MLSNLDAFLQWVALLQVYDQEVWLLPLAVASIIATRNRPWAIPFRRVLMTLLLIYVVAYEMDRYSLIAVPLLVLAITADAVRDFWYRWLGGLAEALGGATRMRRRKPRRLGHTTIVLTDVIQDGWRWATGAASRAARRIRQGNARAPARALDVRQQRVARGNLTSWGVQFVAIVAAFYWFNVRPELWLLAAAAAAIPILLALAPGWRFLAERAMRRELQRDPRLGRYLTWLRRTRARSAEDGASILAENWICLPRRRPRPGPGPSSGLRRWLPARVRSTGLEPTGALLWLVRRLVRRRRMMSIESTFVTQNLMHQRALSWRAFQQALYASSPDGRSAAAGPPPAPQVASADTNRARLRWLAMTEALAECVAFSNEQASDVGVRPLWLLASELLAHAGEVELEAVLDLKRMARDRSGMSQPEMPEPADLATLIAGHTDLAAKYFDLSASCVENHLKRGSAAFGRPLGRRWQQAVGDRAPSWQGPTAQPGGSTEYAAWLNVLALRYQLLDQLHATLRPGQKSGVPKVRHVVPLFGSDLGNEPPPGLQAAALARDAAESCLWLALHQGDPGSRWVFDDRRIWADRLRQADYWRARLLRATASNDLPDVLAHIAVRRALHLWGLAIEQDLDVLRPGTDIWRDRLETAADMFIYEGSLRIRQLAALADRQMQRERAPAHIVELV